MTTIKTIMLNSEERNSLMKANDVCIASFEPS